MADSFKDYDAVARQLGSMTFSGDLRFRYESFYGQQNALANPDEPGALARLFTDVGDAGVNVEDISIEHDAVREIGYLSLSVTPEQSDGLIATMRARGWSVG